MALGPFVMNQLEKEYMEPTLQKKYDRLRSIIADMESMVIGLSSGLDSMLLAKVAHDVLGEKALAVTADTPAMPRRELAEAKELARRLGIRHRVIPAAEMEDPRYIDNPLNRCYFCKYEIFRQLSDVVQEEGFRQVAHGENVDDEDDHRPGSLAAKEWQVCAPLREAGLTKEEIRALARHLELPNWDKPAFTCLSTRIPYGTRITLERLSQVEAAENLLYELGFHQFRVRHHDAIARIELDPAQMADLLAQADQIVEQFQELGFTYVTMDLAGYERGSMLKTGSA